MTASMEKFSGFCPVVVMAATVVFCTVGVVTVNVVSCGCTCAALGGAAVAPDGTLLAAIAHPGAAPGARWDQPATRWPNMRADEPPRSTVVTLAR